MVFEENKENIDELLSRKKRPHAIVSYIDMPATHATVDEWKKYYENKADQVNIWKLNRWPHSGDKDFSFKQCEPCRCIRLDTLNGLYIKVNGEVSPCCYDYNTELSIGNITQTTLKEILDGEALRKLKAMQERDSLRDSELICGDCDQLYSRDGALVYSSNKDMRIGRHSIFCKEEA